MANDFSGDSDVVALYNFESGALTDDSKNANDLTSNGTPTADTVNYKQGAASVELASASTEYYNIDDADMSSDFPLKSGTTNDTFSILGWIYPTAAARNGFVSKYDSGASLRSLTIRRESGGQWSVLQGYNSGANFDQIVANVGTSDEDQWYHIKFTYDDQDWTLRIWGDTEDSTVVDTSGTATNAISILTEPWELGRYNNGSPLDGNLDEVIFFSRVVSDADQDDIIAGTYSSGGYTLSADSGTYAITGQDASLLADFAADAESGAYTITGSDASLLKGYTVGADPGAYSITGQDAALLADFAVGADAGAFSIVGFDADLIYDAGYVLSAEAGVYGITGQDASLLFDRVVSADSGVFTVTGFDANLLYGTVYTLDAESGSFAIAGQDAGLLRDLLVSADSGAYNVTGQDAGFLRDIIMQGDAGAFAVTGFDAVLIGPTTLVGPMLVSISAYRGDVAFSSKSGGVNFSAKNGNMVFTKEG